MKVKCIVSVVTEREVEVDDKFLPLCSDDFWANNNREANQLSNRLREEVNSGLLDDDETELIYIEDMNGNIIFE
jgi:serine/threonine protein phosphatase PrpC